MLAEILPLLRCPVCRAALVNRADGALVCQCARAVPVTDGVPRFVDVPETEAARRTQASFGYEWTHFNNWQESGATNFNDYFEGVRLESLADSVVLDAGCGMGRHARQVAPFARQVVAMDFSRAIDQARRNTGTMANVECVQADLLALPFADNSFDFVYSLGVLHHLAETERALQGLVAKVRPGGRLRVYLYWKCHGIKGVLLTLATLARLATTRMPFPLLRVWCWCLSVLLFALVVLPYRALNAIGLTRHRQWPLFVYSKYPFNVLYNDQFDRFSAPIEKRYDPDEVKTLLEGAGLTDVQVRPCFGWVADGTKPG